MLSQYNLFGLLKFMIDRLITLLFYKNARIIRRPFYIRGKKYIDLGKNLTTGVGCRLDAFASKNKFTLTFGKNVQINDYVHIGAVESVTIGNNVLIASKVFITDHNYGSFSGNMQNFSNIVPIERQLYSKPVTIEDNV